MTRFAHSGVLATIAALAGIAQAAGQPMCRPALAFKTVSFSQMRPPSMRRTWTAVVTVDASRCAAASHGHFEIVLRRLQEFGPDSESSEEFIWAAPEVTVAVALAATEAIERYRIG